MKKTLLITILLFVFLLAGCGKGFKKISNIKDIEEIKTYMENNYNYFGEASNNGYDDWHYNTPDVVIDIMDFHNEGIPKAYYIAYKEDIEDPEKYARTYFLDSFEVLYIFDNELVYQEESKRGVHTIDQIFYKNYIIQFVIDSKDIESIEKVRKTIIK